MASQVVLITGCSRGIGKEAALYLARDSERRFRVYATMRDLEKQEELKKDAGATLNETLFIRELDVTKQNTIDKTVKEIIDNEGKIDVLVSNAGRSLRDWWETCSMDSFYDIMEVNYFGCVRMTKAVVPHMKEKRCGRIIQISSVLGFHGIPASPQYVASKFALEGFSESICPPLRKFNIWVTLIEPGYVETDMTKQYGGKPENIYVDKAKSIPDEKMRDIVTQMVSFDPDIVLGTSMQKSLDLAKQIQDVILSEKPDFRHQTSQIGKDLAKKHFFDPTGTTIIESWLKG